MERTVTTDLQSAEALIGLLFTTPKELRHLAEQSLGQLFVRTELLSEDEHSAHFILRPPGMGEIRVRAERERAHMPFQITHVDTIDD
jgi:hypothetical protein